MPGVLNHWVYEQHLHVISKYCDCLWLHNVKVFYTQSTAWSVSATSLVPYPVVSERAAFCIGVLVFTQ